VSLLQAVCFDFDGVIADTEPLHLRAYQRVLTADGIELSRDDYYARYLGYDDVGLFQALADDRGITVPAAKVDEWVASKAAIVEHMLSSDSILFPGAADCVRMFAARVPLAVASGALEPEIDMVLRHAGIRECFAAIASASDGVRGKPAPDLYLLAMAKLSAQAPADRLDPARCIAIEDSHWGLDAARAAGLRTVAVTNTYPASEIGQADLVVDRLASLTLPTVERLLA
jgi:beta-phosphoglucomutase-like phosphatase (HAD superfamily)